MERRRANSQIPHLANKLALESLCPYGLTLPHKEWDIATFLNNPYSILEVVLVILKKLMQRLQQAYVIARYSGLAPVCFIRRFYRRAEII